MGSSPGANSSGLPISIDNVNSTLLVGSVDLRSNGIDGIVSNDYECV